MQTRCTLEGEDLWLIIVLIHSKVYGLLALVYILFLPVMHAYCHGLECQSCFSPRMIMGLGTKIDGEGHERTFSYLSKRIGTTIRATIENRELEITMMLENLARDRVRRLPLNLRKQIWKTLNGEYRFIVD